MKDDYEHLNTINDGVENLDTSRWGDVKKLYQKWIVNDTEEYLEKIKPAEDISEVN